MELLLIPTLVGFSIALSSEPLQGRKKARENPMPSLAFGLLLNNYFQGGWGTFFLGGLLSVVGWYIYRLTFLPK